MEESQKAPEGWTIGSNVSWSEVLQQQEQPKREFPKPLEGVDWQQCRSAVEAGLDLAEAASIFKVSYEALRKRSQREGWLHPAKIESLKNEKMKQAALSQVCPNGERPASSALEAVSATLEGYRSRTLLGLAKLAEKGVSRAIDANLEIENWQDAKIAADIAMKLHQVGQEAVQVNICNAFADMDEGKLVETEGEIIADEGSRDSYFIDAE